MDEEYPYNPLYELQSQSGYVSRDCTLRGCRLKVFLYATYFPFCSWSHREEFYRGQGG